MKFTSATVEVLAETIRTKDKLDATISLLFPSDLQLDVLAKSFQGQVSPLERSVTLVNATKHFAFVKEGLLWTISNPTQVTDSVGQSITIGNMSPTIGDCIPCKLPTSTFFGRVVTLEQKKIVQQLHLPTTSDITPEDIPCQAEEGQEPFLNADGDEEGGPTLGSARLNLPWNVESDDTAPAFTVVPVFFPLPNGLLIPPGGHPLSEPIAAENLHPIFKSWVNQMKYSKEMNNSTSFNRGGPLFVVDTVLTAFPNVDSNYPFVESIECKELVPLNPTSPSESTHFQAIQTVEGEYQSQKIIDYALRKGLSLSVGLPGTPPKHPADPTLQDSPTTGTILKQLVAGIDKLAHSPGGGSGSSAARETIAKRSMMSKARYQAAFGRTIPSDQPGHTPIFEPAELTAVGLSILESTSVTAAATDFGTQLQLEISKARSSELSIYAKVSLRSDQLADSCFVAGMMNYRFPTESLSTNPGQLRNTITIWNFLRQKIITGLYQERMANNMEYRIQEEVQEESSKRAKKATELFCDGDIEGFAALNAMSNLLVTFSVFAVAFEKSDIWRVGLKPYHLLLQQSGAWRSDIVRGQAADFAIFNDIQLILTPYFLAAMDHNITAAIFNDRPVSYLLLKDANENAKRIQAKLASAIQAGEAGSDYSRYPSYSRHLPQYVPPAGGVVNSEGVSPPGMVPGAFHTPTRQKPPAAGDKNIGTPGGRQRPGGRQPGAQLTPEERQAKIDHAKSQGFLSYSGTKTRIRQCTVRVEHPRTKKTERCCTNFITRGFYCLRADCAFVHPANMNRFTPGQKAEMCTYVDGTEDLNFVEGKRPQSAVPPVLPSYQNVPSAGFVATNSLSAVVDTLARQHYSRRAAMEVQPEPTGVETEHREPWSIFEDDAELSDMPALLYRRSKLEKMEATGGLNNAADSRLYYDTDDDTDSDDDEEPLTFPRHSELFPTSGKKTSASNDVSRAIPDEIPADDPIPAPLKNKIGKSERELFVKKSLPSAVQTKLNQPFGKPNLQQCFKTEAVFRHVCIPVLRSGFLDDDDLDRVWSASRHVRMLFSLFRKYAQVDFTSLQGFPAHWEQETDINEDRVHMFTAALLHFDGDVSSVVRWIGGQHVGDQMDRDERLRNLKPILDEELYGHVERILRFGIPAGINAESSEENFQSFMAYGNHKSVDKDPEELNKNLVKGFKRSFFLAFDPRMVHFMLNCHLTPHGIANPGTSKSRLVFDGSFRPTPAAYAINDWVDIHDTEPPMTFMDSFMKFLRYLYNLRITYPDEEIYIGDDDVAGAFRLLKHHPDVVGMMSFLAQDRLWCYSGGSFGTNYTPPNFDPLARARQLASQYFWKKGPETIKYMRPYMEPIQLQDPPSATEVANFTRADPDSKLQGVLDATGERLPPDYSMWVDDNAYADICATMERTVAASFRGLYETLGYPQPEIAPEPLARGAKLSLRYNHWRKWIGLLFNTRQLCLSPTPEKRTEVLHVIGDWLDDPQGLHTLLQFSQLHGKLESFTRYTKWGRVWFFALQNAIRLLLQQQAAVVIRKFQRKKLEAALRPHLPKKLYKRLDSLVAQTYARALWHSRAEFPVSRVVLNCLQTLREALANPRFSWSQQIGFLIERDPHVVSWGDAATTKGGGGAYCPKLKFWFDVVWSDRVIAALEANELEINSLEFIVVLLQIAAITVRTRTLAAAEQAEFFPAGLPAELVMLIWVDNTSAMSWANKLTSKSASGQRLLGVLSEFLRTQNVGMNARHIKGEDNIIADFISRLNRLLSHRERIQQLFQSESVMASWAYFRPSPELMSLLRSLLFSEHKEGLPSLPKNLGQFGPDASTFLCSAIL